jgi:hypothetical protein
MTQNHATLCTVSFRQLPRRKDTFRDQTERTLGEIAYVLHLTRKVKDAILEEKAVAAK